jgi:hypothetical protein
MYLSRYENLLEHIFMPRVGVGRRTLQQPRAAVGRQELLLMMTHRKNRKQQKQSHRKTCQISRDNFRMGTQCHFKKDEYVFTVYPFKYAYRYE